MLSFLPVWVLAKAKERGSSNMPNLTKTLPLELIREILLRLPVRSVLRFKCVCKSWLSLISDPQFAISHYDLAAAPSHRLLLRTYRFYVESNDEFETDLQIMIQNSKQSKTIVNPKGKQTLSQQKTPLPKPTNSYIYKNKFPTVL